MKTIFTVVILSLGFLSNPAQGNILFCDFNEKAAHLTINDLENSDPDQIMRESSFYGENAPSMDLTLDEILTHDVSDEAIQVEYTAHTKGQRAGAVRVFADLTRQTINERVCISPAFGVPPRCSTRAVERYLGSVQIKNGTRTYRGDVTCDWQFRNIH